MILMLFFKRSSSLLLPVFLAVFLFHANARADLLLKMELEHSSIVEGEPVNILVTFANETDNTIIIDSNSSDETTGFLFDIERTKGGISRRIKDNPLIEKMILRPDEQQSVMIDVAGYYDLLREGTYIITGVLAMKGRFYRSEKKVVEVVKGIELASQTRTVVYSGENRTRSFTLRYWTRDKKEWLFLSVEDNGGQVHLGTFQLGPVIRYYKPQLKTDREGNITAYHQSGPNRFTRTVFKSTPYEIIFMDQNYYDEGGNLLKHGAARLEEVEEPQIPPEANLPKKEDKPRKRRGLLNWLFE